ncbi:fatty acid-binding protein, liver-like [Pseudophryne corroboree]|uniref:fatty acid-binding protein, liver-like n=1 Tax=Pseudophryne corroboree TaxID=495146 RepID=UPI0030821D95
MSFTGTYAQQSHENFEAFMRGIGIPDEFIQKGKDAKTVTEIVQDGKHFVVTATTGPRVQRNEFTVGEEAELGSLTNEKIRTTVNLVDGKLVADIKGVHSVTEISGDLLIDVMTVKDVVYKRISKRV